jgi:hypothetical protein
MRFTTNTGTLKIGFSSSMSSDRDINLIGVGTTIGMWVFEVDFIERGGVSGSGSMLFVDRLVFFDGIFFDDMPLDFDFDRLFSFFSKNII